MMKSPGGALFSENCEAINRSGNAGQTIVYNEDWFVNPDVGDFHLSAAGQVAAGLSAQWSAGDPLYDIDGDARPQSTPGAPGIDQP